MADGRVRLFVAVPVPPAALESCRGLVDGVRTGPVGGGARWVRTENLHLTLRFLGATPPDRVADVARAVHDAAAGRAAFDVRLTGAGAFPSPRRPRALWLGIERGARELGALAAALEAPLADLGWPPEDRPFRAHLTVARTDAASIADGAATAGALIEAARDWSVSFRADHVVLFRSHLGGGPPRYEPLEAVALRA